MKRKWWYKNVKGVELEATRTFGDDDVEEVLTGDVTVAFGLPHALRSSGRRPQMALTNKVGPEGRGVHYGRRPVRLHRWSLSNVNGREKWWRVWAASAICEGARVACGTARWIVKQPPDDPGQRGEFPFQYFLLSFFFIFLSDSADGKSADWSAGFFFCSMEIHVGDLFVNQRFVSVTLQLLCAAARSGLYHPMAQLSIFRWESWMFPANFDRILKFKYGT